MVLVVRPCKPLSTLRFNVFVVSDCAVEYFLFSEGEEIFFNSILSAWERWKLFCKLWSVHGLVRLANVLTPVRWLVLMLLNCLLIILLVSIPYQLLFVVCLEDNPIC